MELGLEYPNIAAGGGNQRKVRGRKVRGENSGASVSKRQTRGAENGPGGFLRREKQKGATKKEGGAGELLS